MGNWFLTNPQKVEPSNQKVEPLNQKAPTSYNGTTVIIDQSVGLGGGGGGANAGELDASWWSFGGM